MLTIWLLTAISMLFGVATGLVNSAAPQAVQALQLSSIALGLVGAGVPAGYTASCLLCGKVFSGMSSKRVLLGGTACAALSLLLMAVAKSSTVIVAAQILFGLASGAMWPFCSAWLLEFESATISHAYLLRHYNVSWTAGTALGMYAGGQICSRGWIFENFQIASAVAVCAIVLGAIARDPRRHGDPALFPADPILSAAHTDPAPLSANRRDRVSLSALMAAVLFNFAAIGTKIVIAVNYAELNKKLGGGADRMGLLMAVGILSQLAAFGAGKWYEPLLGLRRVYVVGALILIAANWTFACSTWLPALVLAEAATGFVLAMAFQGAILAFTARSKTPRHGTTLLEASVGAAGLAPLAAGALSEYLKASGVELLDALRAPFYAGMGLIAMVLIAQLLLVPAEKERRRLMLTSA